MMAWFSDAYVCHSTSMSCPLCIGRISKLERFMDLFKFLAISFNICLYVKINIYKFSIWILIHLKAFSKKKNVPNTLPAMPKFQLFFFHFSLLHFKYTWRISTTNQPHGGKFSSPRCGQLSNSKYLLIDVVLSLTRTRQTETNSYEGVIFSYTSNNAAQTKHT